MIQITALGGADEIGGNKILLEDKDTRVWFDFGQSFSFGEEWFAGYLQPRKNRGLRDHFEFPGVPLHIMVRKK